MADWWGLASAILCVAVIVAAALYEDYRIKKRWRAELEHEADKRAKEIRESDAALDELRSRLIAEEWAEA